MIELMKQEPSLMIVVAFASVACTYIVCSSLVNVSTNIAKAIMYKKENK